MIMIDKHLIREKSTRNLPKNKNLVHFSKKNRRAGFLIEIKRNLSWVMDNLKDFIIAEYR